MRKIVALTFTSLLFTSMLVAQTHCARLVHVNPLTDQITIKNFDTSSIDLTSHWFCSFFTYSEVQNTTLISGSIVLAPGEEATFEWAGLIDTAADLALYNGTTFTDPNQMLDFTQWGAGGLGRESVAVAKGIWLAGQFIELDPPYVYSGTSCADNYYQFWGGPESLSESQLRSQVQINLSADMMTIQMEGLQDATISLYSVNGALVLNQKLQGTQSETIPIRDLDKGAYLLQFQTSEGSFVEKFAILH